MGVQIPVANISLQTLIRECSLRKKPDQDLFYDFSLSNRENVHQVFKYRKFNYDFSDYLTVFNDEEHVIGYFRPCYDEFLHSILCFLGIPMKRDVEDNDDLTALMKSRIEKLKTIKTEAELKEEFPYLYNDLIQGRSFIAQLDLMEQKTDADKERYERHRHYYYSCALKQRLDRFVETQSVLYERFVNRRKEYKERIEKKGYNRLIKENFDTDKMAMLVIHNYLILCEGTNDKELIKVYIKLIKQYLTSPDYRKDVTITTDEGVKVNLQNIKSRVTNVLRKMEDEESKVEWELVPRGNNFQRVYTEHPTPRTTIFNYEELERLRKKGERKRSFYESTPYLVRVIGLLNYRGYIGYIYPNGEVLLDKEYKESAPTTAVGDAIYHIKAIDFEALSKLDKTQLKKNPKVKRIIHSKYWEEKAREVIDREGTEEEQEAARQLIKRLKEKNQ